MPQISTDHRKKKPAQAGPVKLREQGQVGAQTVAPDCVAGQKSGLQDGGKPQDDDGGH